MENEGILTDSENLNLGKLSIYDVTGRLFKAVERSAINPKNQCKSFLSFPSFLFGCNFRGKGKYFKNYDQNLVISMGGI